jgi:hypothetical protein
MRTLLTILPIIFLLTIFFACKKDAFTPPYRTTLDGGFTPPYLNGDKALTDTTGTDSTKNRDFSIDNRDF